ncbi:GUN4 domain-containing protein [Lyngbya sp. CCAP 1446/10]|nr:GUN4 domain-containing protein [Lyngbya sp. CCAP 1446/10]
MILPASKRRYQSATEVLQDLGTQSPQSSPQLPHQTSPQPSPQPSPPPPPQPSPPPPPQSSPPPPPQSSPQPSPQPPHQPLSQPSPQPSPPPPHQPSPQPSPQTPPQTPQPQPDSLKSAQGVDYTYLRDLLAAEKWKEADQETLKVMLKAAGREKKGWFTRKSIDNFPCDDLRTIDQLWVKYSQGHFGFSVQKKIWLKVGGKVDIETKCKLGDRVGWREGERWLNYSNITFNKQAPQGHLPACGVWLFRRVVVAVLSLAIFGLVGVVGVFFWFLGWFELSVCIIFLLCVWELVVLRGEGEWGGVLISSLASRTVSCNL